ncbi:MAG: DUF4254 domain-containing protein [Muribaculaceae bacterium]|nr:DUF4254 domain-containing protein [Muribaculaceae bacterium]MDE7368436.1 DUF4254 domain-containing protein [Muribaculaceae bacterium]
MIFAEKCNEIFDRSTSDYHLVDDVDAVFANPYAEGTVEHILYAKNNIDAVQWHLEDIVRDPDIDPVKALEIKRRIDRLNQERTDLVEDLDTYFLKVYSEIQPDSDATINTESPAWAIDRLSILALKIYHMEIEEARKDASPEHIARCRAKLNVLLEQRKDLIAAINTLLADIRAGRKYMKVYRQMKMYNDPETNPVLYGAKEN